MIPLRDALEQQRIALNLDNHVSFLGFIARVPEFPAAIAAAIARLAHAPELRAAFARAVHEKVLREFSVDAMVEGNLRVYESLIR